MHLSGLICSLLGCFQIDDSFNVNEIARWHPVSMKALAKMIACSSVPLHRVSM